VAAYTVRITNGPKDGLQVTVTRRRPGHSPRTVGRETLRGHDAAERAEARGRQLVEDDQTWRTEYLTRKIDELKGIIP
jgi:hypothetical protein